MTPTPPHPPTVESLLHHRTWLQGLARRLVLDPADADDLAQQTWLAALESPPAHGASVRGWLATVLRNFARKRDRASVRRGFREAQVEALVGPRPTAEVVAHADALRHVTQAVMELEDPYRTTLLLRFFEDLPPRDVAARMGVPVETVRTRVRRGLALLRDQLDGVYGSRRAWCLVLLPLTGADGTLGESRGAPSGAAALTGIGLMSSMTSKLTAAAVAVVLAVGGYWATTSGGASPAAGDPSADVAVAQSERAEGATARVRRPAAGTAASEPTAREPDPRDPAPAPTPVLRLRLADGTPAAGGSVVAFDSESARLAGPTGTDGVLTLTAEDAGRSLVAVLPGFAPVLADAPAAGDSVDVVFERGALVAGLLRVDGVPAPAGIQLQLSCVDVDAPPDGIPRHAWEQLESTGFDRWRRAALTDVSGRFAFAAPVIDTARIRPPQGYEWTERAARDMRSVWLEFAVPNTTLTLDVRPLPVLRGRVVREADGAPVEGARASFHFLGDGFQGSRSEQTDEQGMFELIVPANELQSSGLTVYVAGEAAVLQLPLGSRFGGVRDLGELVLPATHTVQVLVRGPQGQRVAGAIVERADPTHPYRSQPTSADGATRVDVMAGRTPVRVTATGYMPADAELVAPSSAPTVVELVATSLLHLRLPPPNVKRPPALRLILSAPTPIFVGEVDEMLHRRGGEIAQPGGYTENGDGSTSYVFAINDAPDLLLAGMRGGDPFELRLVDGFGVEHVRREIRIGTAERQELTLELAGAGRSLRGFVRDTEGEPLARARVVFAAVSADGQVSGRGISIRTAADGRFAFDGLHAERAQLVVLKTGRVPLIGRTVDVPPEGVDLDLRMKPGRTVQVQIVDEAGTPLDEPWAYAEIPGGQPWDAGTYLWSLDETDDGGLEIQDLPAREMVLVVEVGEEEQRIPFDAREDEVRIVVKRPER